MDLGQLSPLANHLWQSTLLGAAAWPLTLALRKNRAAVRYRIWLAASIKFLVPFSLLMSIGGHMGLRTASAIEHPQFSLVMSEIGQPFAMQPPMHLARTATPALNLVAILFAVWLCGVSIGILIWLRWWLRMRAIQRTARPLHLNLPIRAMSALARLEPGVIGIWDPVLLLPDGIMDRLTRPQLEAVLAHELCHVRRRDNLTGAIHLLVETIFWFHPLVWSIRERPVDERERACDEDVLEIADPHIYAAGILNVCKFYLESPSVCVSGITGSDLKKRIEHIMANRRGERLGPGRRLLVAAAGALAVTGPVLVGLLHARPTQAQTSVSDKAAFEVASIKPNRAGGRPSVRVLRGGTFTTTNATLKYLAQFAYNAQDYQLSGGPKWTDSIGYDITAKPEHAVNPGPDNIGYFRQMLQGLLEDRFKLTLQHTTRELPVYALTVGKDGPKLKEREKPANPTDMRMNGGRGLVVGQQISLNFVAENLSARLGRPVRDETGLQGYYDFRLEWTPDESVPAPPGDTASGSPPPDRTGPSIFTALQEQLGLKLEARKGPVEVLVIDHVENPSEN